MAFFFSIAGAYLTGAKLVSSMENSFFTFLEDYQTNDEYLFVDMFSFEDLGPAGFYMSDLDDMDNGPAFHEFLNGYVWYQFFLLLTAFWHVLFVIAMGTT